MAQIVIGFEMAHARFLVFVHPQPGSGPSLALRSLIISKVIAR
jgi:hypothetical protein